jgi:hypothetical protein
MSLFESTYGRDGKKSRERWALVDDRARAALTTRLSCKARRDYERRVKEETFTASLRTLSEDGVGSMASAWHDSVPTDHVDVFVNFGTADDESYENEPWDEMLALRKDAKHKELVSMTRERGHSLSRARRNRGRKPKPSLRPLRAFYAGV